MWVWRAQEELRARFQSLTSQIEEIDTLMNETEKEAVKQIKRCAAVCVDWTGLGGVALHLVGPGR